MLPHAPHRPPDAAGPDRRPPRAARERGAVVALVVIGVGGAVGVLAAFVVGIGVLYGCSTGHASGFACSPVRQGLVLYGSAPATVVATLLAAVGVARPRSTLGWTRAAWIVWGGFCAIWWGLVLLGG